jgi:hypothetical protein
MLYFFEWGKNKGFYLLCRIFALFKTVACRIYFYEWKGYAVNGG